MNGHSSNALRRSAANANSSPDRLSDNQRRWLARGLTQAGGKLPLFDEFGQKVSTRTVRSCVKQGWAEPWFENPIKKDWLVCKLTEAGRKALSLRV